jgi:hypothetical protein
MSLSNNNYEKLLTQNKNFISQRWINLIASTYPAEFRFSRIDHHLRILL